MNLSPAYWLGLTSPNSGPYLFWSGFGGDASKIAGLVWLGRFFHKHHHHHKENTDV